MSFPLDLSADLGTIDYGILIACLFYSSVLRAVVSTVHSSIYHLAPSVLNVTAPSRLFIPSHVVFPKVLFPVLHFSAVLSSISLNHHFYADMTLNSSLIDSCISRLQNTFHRPSHDCKSFTLNSPSPKSCLTDSKTTFRGT